MHKVITINLNGIAYQIEESGYDALLDYLDNAGAQLEDNPDRAEIIADLEQAIAEKCHNFLRPQKNVVTTSEIEQIIREMGPVDGDAGDAGETGSATDAGKSKKASGPGAAHTGNESTHGAKSGADTGAPRRLFRIYEGRRLSGVCKGLAAYIGMDVTLVRLIFVVLAFLTHGIMIPIYIILVVVVPYAQTSEDYAAAYGMPFNTKDFINDAKQHYGDLKNEGKDWQRRAKQHTREWQRAWRRGFRNPRRWWGDRGPHHLFFGFVMSLLGFFLLLYLFQSVRFSPFMYQAQAPVWIGIVMLLIVLRLVFAPFRIAHDYSRSGYGRSPAGMLVSWLSIFFTVGMLYAVVFAYNHVPEVHYFFQDAFQEIAEMWRGILNH